MDGTPTDHGASLAGTGWRLPWLFESLEAYLYIQYRTRVFAFMPFRSRDVNSSPDRMGHEILSLVR